jgi:hypothetical protein
MTKDLATDQGAALVVYTLRAWQATGRKGCILPALR